MFKIPKYLVVVLLIAFTTSPRFSFGFFQDDPPLKTKLGISCVQLPDHQIKIQVQLRAREDNQYVPVPNASVEIFALTDSTEVLLGKEKSNKKGKIEIKVNANEHLIKNEEGFYSIKASYAGDDNYQDNEDELLFKPAILEIEAAEEDSVKTITVKLYEDSEETTPLEDVEVVLQVPRMYSNLTIATETTDEDGMVSFEFPNDLPGGNNGELTIIAKVNDIDEYASLEGQIENNWGVPVSTLKMKDRALWSPNAPWWMVYTFAILMTLVWGHFIIIIYKLSLIRKEGKALANKTS